MKSLIPAARPVPSARGACRFGEESLPAAVESTMITAPITTLDALDALTSAKHGVPVVTPDTSIEIPGHGLDVVKSGRLTFLYVYPDGAEEPVRKVLVRGR